jgi:hypothetical protein
LEIVGLLVGVVIACSTSGAPSNRALANLLDASTPKEFNDELFKHGPIREEELPAIFEATSSTLDYRRRNAAKLLRTTVKGNAVELEHRVVLETKYVEVWAIVLDDVMPNDPSMAGRRPDMIKAALGDSDPNILSVGLRAAALSNYIRALTNWREIISVTKMLKCAPPQSAD